LGTNKSKGIGEVKRYVWALALLFLAACGNITGDTVARVDSVSLTRQDVDARVDRIVKGFQKQEASGAPLPSKLEIEQQVVEQFITQNLVVGLAKERGITVSDTDIDGQIENFKVIIPQATGGTLEDAVQDQLGLPGVASTEFRQFVSYFLAQQRLGESLVTTDTVRIRITDEVMLAAQQEVEKATVAHILVNTEEEAKQVIERLDQGEDFAALAKELSQDPGSKDNGGVYEGIARGEFVPEFEKAMFEDLQPGETTKIPVQSQFGYHVIRLISREKSRAMTDEEAQLQIEQRVPDEVQQARGQALEELITSERQKAVTANRIQEPTYPTPTPPVLEQPAAPVVTPAPAP
jgi:parvulin-like peptidyl-prolyl isomerase